jgi:hypothetical protein
MFKYLTDTLIGVNIFQSIKINDAISVKNLYERSIGYVLRH